jgi:hypothetical protein
MSNYDYWMNKKIAYEHNLRNGIGDTVTIKFLLDKINKKLEKICKKNNKPNDNKPNDNRIEDEYIII